ncbi:quinone oxidoreductase family protein [Pengzhenrongella frigida]|uniref:NADP-dependent oxidoreductase n=1 Tax=Pengzhenrongella frigida TaxID=1259133 RepID=A0A4Q5MZQ8_9MICO|nr:NADP-dependent oxidoreductase [Cellulomonas sp. HLT2-17]RYV51229.1 NADP-dependent oxidoreductase [Cellulomonas sp. HLT2-17]
MSRSVVATAYGGPEVLSIVSTDPGEPGEGEVLLKVEAAGVNPIDWKSYTGTYGTDPSKLPIRLGQEAAGTVLRVGPGVEGIVPGDDVIAYRAPGAYSEQLVVRATATVHKPALLTWEKAGGLLLAGVTAMHTVVATRIGPGDTVLVHGAAGGVGSMVVQIARARGARVVGTASLVNHEYLMDIGAIPVVYGPGLAARVREHARSGVTAAIDTVGTAEALDTSVALVPDRQRIATIANFAHGAVLRVLLLGSGPGADPGTEIRAKARQQLVDLVVAGRLDVRLAGTYHFADAAKAHRAGIAGHARGKMILRP